MSADHSMQTISRTIQILRSFSKDEKELSLAEFHHKLGLSKSSLQRILNTLVNFGFLEKDEKRKTYRLGNELYYLGKLVEEHSHLLTVTKPYLKAMRDRLGESVYLNIIEQNERKCIAFEEGKHDLMTISYIGQTSPLYAGASAKLLLAFMSPEEMTNYLQQTTLQAITDATVTDKDKLLGELREIRAQGYASSYGERVIGVCSVSAPIFNRWGETIAGVSISAPMIRVSEETYQQFVQAITETARQISEEFKFSIA
ncbi:IclR family transcriptional regulator [Brevibacillus choshinensis]|uniref:IclR family transcriptional regulator n=1 Tax=Brevibacillus choshinensis TaxID=54911 RepID=A0ABX7FWN8_BRECH|nr:IclR family transcriptional regulator [Brevibacillus choshinensis]QRG70164.1 IclR family transcriptional regulator [Brevibacillus choshinensis]